MNSFVLRIFFTMLSISLLNLAISSARADTALNSSNWIGPTGAHYWYIDQPGTYYLDVAEQIFSTTANNAIRIACSNVVLDGRGKTITGTGPPASASETGPDVYGVRANAGGASSNVTVKNLNVEKKFYGIILEAVANGAINAVNTSNNNTGIYLWDTDNNTISDNISNNNLNSGIVLDGDNCVNTGNTFSNNTTSSNAQFGIMLWLDCPISTLTGNTGNYNGNSGISLSSGSGDSILAGNTAGYNPNGIHVKSSNNTIGTNTLTYNTNVGLWLESSIGNTISNNVASNNQTAGIWLTTSGTNSLTSNTCDSNTGTGMVLDNGSNSNTLTTNTTNENSNLGMAVQNASNSNTVTGHTANNNSNGIQTTNSTGNEIKSGTFANNQNNGLWVESSSGNTIKDNNVTGSYNAGIFIQSSTNDSISGNTIANNTFWGIFLNSCSNQTIYNNNFSNANGNAGFAGTNTGNVWNVSKTAGQNIVGGPYLGGNFWGKPDGTGFSQITEDSNGDGICDSANTLTSGNVDNLPLHTYAAVTELYVNQEATTPPCGGKTPCYASIQGAIDDAISGATIKVAHGNYNDPFELNSNKSINIEGGWDFSFAAPTSTPTIVKTPVITAGGITFLNLIKIAP
jgi:parallel beta-helix repeat protein